MRYFSMVLIYLILLLLPHSVEAAEGVWTAKKPSPNERSEVAVVSLNEKIYVIGGFKRLGVTDLVEEYTPSTDTWATKAPIPQSLHHAAAAAVRGRIYVIGGFRRLWPWKPVNSVYEYDPASNRWSRKAYMTL